MNKPTGYTSYVNDRSDVPFEGSPGILKKKPEPEYKPEEFLPQLASPKVETVYSNPMP